MHHYLIEPANFMKGRLSLTSRIVLILFISLIFADSEAYSQCLTQPPSAPGSLILTTVTTSASTPTPTPTASASGLVAHWKFDEATGTTACDSSGNGNTGTLINGPLRAVGRVGGALYFDGIDDHVTVADSNSLDVSNSFTLSAWVNPASSFTDFRSILVKNYKYYLYASVAGYCGSGSPLAGFDEQTTNTVCQLSPLAANTWTHLAATYTGSTLTLYRNGVAVASSNIAKTLSPTTGTLQIGASQFGENFKGLIDEVRVHNRALTNTEIQALFQQESAVRESGLVAHWKFEEGNGTTASDSSGSGNAGILTNGPLWTDGRIGKGLSFDGIDDHVTVADSNSLDVSSSFTLSAWVNPASAFTDFRSILVKNYKYYLYASVAGYCGNGSPLAGFSVDEQTSANVCQASPLPTNTWTHLAATYNGSILTLYRNGVAVASSNIAKTLSPTTGTLQIGASEFGENFKGLIDEVRVHNRALTHSEIQAIFQQESGDIVPISAPVVTAPATGSLFSYLLSNSGDKSVFPGASVTNSIGASLASGTSQAISFSVSGLPSGATGSFSSPSCTPTCSSTLTINTTGSTSSGSSTITVAAAGGGTSKTTTFTLTVSGATVATVATVAPPTISPNGGSFTGPVSVTMQTATSGASIYYTTNGSTPTQSSTLYTGTITLASSATVKAKGFKSGSNPSTEATTSFAVAPVGTATNGVVRYADGSLAVTSCTNYSPSTRLCSGGSDIAYGTGLAVENASLAAAATDVILVRASAKMYIGTDVPRAGVTCVKTRSGTSTSARHLIRGYQSEYPQVMCFNVEAQFVHVYQMKVDSNNTAGSIGFFIGNGNGWRIGEYGFTTEVSNQGAQGIASISNAELINLNVHHNGFNSPDHCKLHPTQCHGVYADESLLIDGGEYHHNEGMGIHCYTRCRNTTIRNVKIHNNVSSGLLVANSTDTNSNVGVYNILAYGNGSNGVLASAAGNLISNVTAIDNGGVGAAHGMLGTLRNSIVSGGYTTATYHYGTGAFLGNSTVSNNITSGIGSSLFVDSANGNFTSTVEGVGADLSAHYN